MHIIYVWVKNIVCFYILLTVVLHLLPKEGYQKYVRFFSGMLLMILIITPVLSLLGKEDVLLKRIDQAGFFQELDNLKLDTEHLEQTQKRAYLKEYERAIGTDISRIAEGKQLNPCWTEVHLSDTYQVESIAMEVSFEKEEGLSVQKASFGDDSKEYPEVYNLKQELMDFYQLEEGQISITVRDG
ncbi:MAG: stage III sporulation protein AF [Lachnospiraceae bacterium]|nr:stage III sporulation protein AF [Lachnospiraceae bacterium]